MHVISEGTDPHGDGPRAQLLASGVGVNWALKAQVLLRDDWGVASDVWSVTSWNELRRDGLEVDRFNLLHPDQPQRVAYVTSQLEGRKGPVVAASDWMRAVQDQIREWVPGDFVSLGTDGWGMSDTRGALRRHFLVDAESITVQTLTVLARRGEIDPGLVTAAIDKYNLGDPAAADAGNTEGSG
jgi:pyruvate dehydrogenase E1 component